VPFILAFLLFLGCTFGLIALSCAWFLYQGGLRSAMTSGSGRIADHRQPANMALQRTRRPRFRSGRSLCSLGSPLNARSLGGLVVQGWAMLNLFLLAPLPLQQSKVLDTRPSASDIQLWAVGPPDGPRREYSVTKELFARVPQWSPEKDPPPLPIARAVGIARKFLKTNHPDWRESESVLWSFQLQQARSVDYPNRWFYAFLFYRLLETEPLPQGEAWVLVLMDGSVIRPKTVQGSLR